jgi:cytoskeletal protein RodZ
VVEFKYSISKIKMVQQKRKQSIRQPYKPSKKRLYISLFAVLLVLLLVVGGGYALYHSKHHAQAAYVTPTGPQTKGEPTVSNTTKNTSTSSTTNTASNTTGSSSTGSNKSSTSGTSTNAPLIAPSGVFVSSHHPMQTSNMASNCTTSPGATCQISFTLGNITKSLPIKTTDAQGTAYWQDWTPKSIGLTEGSWVIKATATLNGATSSTTDDPSVKGQQGLVVQP